MKMWKLVPMGAALLALGLGLSSVAPPAASARDQATVTGPDHTMIIRVAQDDRDRDRDRDNDSSDNSGYLGVQVQRLSAALRRAKGIPESTEGTLVSTVEDDSPADQAGLKRGDVILSVDHQDTPNPADLVRVVRGLDPGHRVSVQVWRDGVTRSYTLKVGSRPADSDMMTPPPPPSWGRGNDDTPATPGMPGMPDPGTRMRIYRQNREDLEKQIHDLQAQVARLESEIRDLQQSLNRGDRDHDQNRDRDRDQDRDDHDRGNGNGNDDGD